jgi:hypothetical protein
MNQPFIAYNDLFMGFVLIVFFAITFPAVKNPGMHKFVSILTLGKRISIWMPRLMLLFFGLLITAIGTLEIIKHR